jgi:hypothetical protein
MDGILGWVCGGRWVWGCMCYDRRLGKRVVGWEVGGRSVDLSFDIGGCGGSWVGLSDMWEVVLFVGLGGLLCVGYWVVGGG